MVKPDTEFFLIERNYETDNYDFRVGDVYVTRKIFELMEKDDSIDAEYLLQQHAQRATNRLGIEGLSSWNFEKHCFEGDVEIVSGLDVCGHFLWIATAQDFSKTIICFLSELDSPPRQGTYVHR